MWLAQREVVGKGVERVAGGDGGEVERNAVMNPVLMGVRCRAWLWGLWSWGNGLRCEAAVHLGGLVGAS